MNMKKIGGYIGLLFMMIFLTSCPFMEDTSEGSTDMQAFIIFTRNKLSFDVKCNAIAYFDTYVGKGGHRNGSSVILAGETKQIVFFDLDDIRRFDGENDSLNISKVFDDFFYDKGFVVTTTSGDTLANWNDSSAVFTQQYWLIEHQENGDVHCTLQLMDEVLKLR